MVICAVFGCSNSHRTRNVHFYRFPKDQRQQAYVEFTCRADNFNALEARICSEHFKPDDYEFNVLGWPVMRNGAPKLKTTAMPSLKCPRTTMPKSSATAKATATSASTSNDALENCRNSQEHGQAQEQIQIDEAFKRRLLDHLMSQVASTQSAQAPRFSPSECGETVDEHNNNDNDSDNNSKADVDNLKKQISDLRSLLTRKNTQIHGLLRKVHLLKVRNAALQNRVTSAKQHSAAVQASVLGLKIYSVKQLHAVKLRRSDGSWRCNKQE